MSAPDPSAPPPRRQREKSSFRSRFLSEYNRQRFGFAGSLVAGVTYGMVVGLLANRYGPTTMYSAVVVEKSIDEHKEALGRYNTPVETSAGQIVDFDETSFPRLMYTVLEQGQPISVTLSDLTGRPVAVDAAGVYYDLLPLNGPSFLVGTVVAAFASVMWFAARQYRFPWFVGTAAFLVGVLIFGGVIG